MFAGLNSTCVSVFGEPVDYTLVSTGATISGVLAVPELNSDEERHADAVYAVLFLNGADLGQKPDHGDTVAVSANASPLNAMGEPRLLPLGSSWTVFEVLIDPVGGVYARIRQDV